MTTYIVLAGAVGAIAFSLVFLLMLIKGNSLKIPFIGMAAFVILMAAGVVLTMLGGKNDSPDTADRASQAVESQGAEDIHQDSSRPDENMAMAGDDEYSLAPEVIYTTSAEENGYGDKNMYADGVVDKIFSYESADVCEATTENGKLALMKIPLLTPNSEWGKLKEGQKIRAYFQYLGYSSVLDKASGALLKVEILEQDARGESNNAYVNGIPVTSNPSNNVTDESPWSGRFTPINDFTYTLDKSKKTVTLNRYRGHDKKIRLSPVYTIGGEDYALVSMGETACFLGKTSITSVYIPEGVTHISDNCFNSCASLKYLYIPSTVQSLGSTFFDYMHEYTAFCDSSASFPGERDENDYEEIIDDTSQAEELGRSLGGAANGFIAGFLSGSEGEVTTEIYYGGTEVQWKSIVK